jgi:hypothetical protein
MSVWLRLDRSFMSVAFTVRRRSAARMSRPTSSAHATPTAVTSATCPPHHARHASPLTSCPPPPYVFAPCVCARARLSLPAARRLQRGEAARRARTEPASRVAPRRPPRGAAEPVYRRPRGAARGAAEPVYL